MRKLGMPYLFITLFMLLAYQSVSAQDTRSLSVDINLDVGVVDRPLDLEMTVNNHSFVFIFPNTILRPITSQQTTLVQLPAGATSITAVINDILPEPVDYTVEINCLNCSDTVPRQYYRPKGNVTGLIDSAYIDPVDLPPQIDVTLITRAQIRGQIRLMPEQIAERDLVFEVSVFNPGSSSALQSEQVILGAGQNDINYVIRGLTRSPTNQLEVRARCLDCGAVVPSEQTFGQLVSTQSDANSIDFVFDTENLFFLHAVLKLILLEP